MANFAVLFLDFLKSFCARLLKIVCTLFGNNSLLQEGNELDIYLDNLLETRTRGERNTKTESGVGGGGGIVSVAGKQKTLLLRMFPGCARLMLRAVNTQHTSNKMQ